MRPFLLALGDVLLIFGLVVWLAFLLAFPLFGYGPDGNWAWPRVAVFLSLWFGQGLALAVVAAILQLADDSIETTRLARSAEERRVRDQ